MRLATLDLETDPFLYARVPLPFAAGFYDGENFHHTWGDDCISQMLEYLYEYPEPCLIYAHNGGKFDFWYLSHAIENPVFFINTRLVKAKLAHHELRDSYSIMPVKLSKLDKDEIDYKKFEYEIRDRHRKEIIRYLKSDCTNLYKYVAQFREQFGDSITIGSTSLKELRKTVRIDHASREFDATFRPYYFGGRVQCFKSGEHRGKFKIYDINSSYPNVMAQYDHPADFSYTTRKSLSDSAFYFADIDADSEGALPIITKNGLSFPHCKRQRFLACSHEINAALELGLLRVRSVKWCHVFQRTITFAEFVERCMDEKIAAEKSGDKGMRTFWKLIANSAYGKLGTNPENFTDTKLFDSVEQVGECNAAIKHESEKWIIRGRFGERVQCERPAEIRGHNFWNVAMAASITSAARAELLRAIQSARNPLYCDTDSLICERLSGVKIHATALGAWKCEAEADTVQIAGKKLYACWKDGECVKAAAKGIVIAPQKIAEIAKGVPAVAVPIDAPTMTVGREPKFMRRTIARTVETC